VNPIKTTPRPIRLPEPLDTHYRQSEAERLDWADRERADDFERNDHT
jgi:hypothetical protein